MLGGATEECEQQELAYARWSAASVQSRTGRWEYIRTDHNRAEEKNDWQEEHELVIAHLRQRLARERVDRGVLQRRLADAEYRAAMGLVPLHRILVQFLMRAEARGDRSAYEQVLVEDLADAEEEWKVVILKGIERARRRSGWKSGASMDVRSRRGCIPEMEFSRRYRYIRYFLQQLLRQVMRAPVSEEVRGGWARVVSQRLAAMEDRAQRALPPLHVEAWEWARRHKKKLGGKDPTPQHMLAEQGFLRDSEFDATAEFGICREAAKCERRYGEDGAGCGPHSRHTSLPSARSPTAC